MKKLTFAFVCFSVLYLMAVNQGRREINSSQDGCVARKNQPCRQQESGHLDHTALDVSPLIFL